MDKNSFIISKWNRDGAKIWMEYDEDNDAYSIHASKPYVLEYVSENYDTLPEDTEDYDAIFKAYGGGEVKAHICSFDPAGGPYMAIGDEFEGMILERIYHKKEGGTLFKFKEK